MRVSYKRLWKLLIDYDMSQAELRQKAGIAPNTMTKLRRNQEVAMCVLIKICSTLNVNIGDVMDLIPETETDRLWGEKNESEL
jgi:DNA-binding Xre family transcriptional regulator